MRVRKNIDLMDELKDPNNIYNKIFQYIRRISNKKKAIYLDQVLNKVKKKFHLEIDDTRDLLEEFTENQVILIDSKNIVTINILANHNRNNIYNLIKKYPGITFNTLKTKLFLGSNQLHWHILFLEKFKLIEIHKYGKFSVYSLPNIKYVDITIGFLLLNKNIHDLLLHINKNQNKTTIPEIIKKYSLSRGSVLHIMKKLTKFSIIQKDKGEIPHKYYIKSSLIAPISQSINRFQKIFTNF